MAPFTHRLRLRNAAQVVTVARNGARRKIKDDMNDLGILRNATVVVGLDGAISAIGTQQDLAALSWYKTASFESDIDCTGKSIIPSFVDGHTHPVWAGDRVHEFAMKLAGATYMEVHNQGGGIQYTVRHTRECPQEKLEDMLSERLDRMLHTGTTVVEAKSGYGMNLETEMKMLKVIHNVDKVHKIKLCATYLGAHSIPEGRDVKSYVEEIINEHMPAMAALIKAGEISPENFDVFYEKGIFEKEVTERMFAAASEMGLAINFHGDELNPMGAGELGGRSGAKAISHLEHVSDEGIKAMAANNIAAVLLPTTAYILRIAQPPARKLIDGGVAIVLATDFNPNAHCTSMPVTMHMACVLLRLTMPEALVASTINAADSLGCSHMYGSLEVGKRGDLVVVDAADWQHIIYRFGDPPIHSVYIGGSSVSRHI